MLSDKMAGTLLFINIDNCLFNKCIMEKLKRPLDTTTEFCNTQAISICVLMRDGAIIVSRKLRPYFIAKYKWR